MILLDGKTLSQSILNSLHFPADISLHDILINDDPIVPKYILLKEEKSRQVGVNFHLHHLPKSTTASELLNLIEHLNNDSSVTGFFVQLPLPSHINIDILGKINPKKDVDGLVFGSPFTPAVDAGVIKLLESTGINLAGKTAVIINDSKLIGIPLQKLLIAKNMQVIICNKFTKNIAEISRGADLLISATGQKGLVTADYIKPGAIVIDIGGGDVNFDEVKQNCSFITPPTGSVGPMTIACLLQNLLLATLQP